MRLFATESSEWNEKAVPPRTSHLARSLVLIYLGLTLGCVLTYWLLGGMSFFQALNHALTTVSTGGGYSTSDSSMGGQFDSPSILLASTVFMAMGAMPFFLFVRFIHGQRQPLLRDQQVRFFLRFLVIVAALLTIYRVLREPVDPFETFVTALFNVTSVVTTTGFASTDYSLWGGPFAVVVFLFITFVGGCSGSTSGGMKIFRFQLSMLLLREQVRRLLHPHAVFARNYNGRVIGDDIVAPVSPSLSFFWRRWRW